MKALPRVRNQSIEYYSLSDFFQHKAQVKVANRCLLYSGLKADNAFWRQTTVVSDQKPKKDLTLFVKADPGDEDDSSDHHIKCQVTVMLIHYMAVKI